MTLMQSKRPSRRQASSPRNRMAAWRARARRARARHRSLEADLLCARASISASQSPAVTAVGTDERRAQRRCRCGLVRGGPWRCTLRRCRRATSVCEILVSASSLGGTCVVHVVECGSSVVAAASVGRMWRAAGRGAGGAGGGGRARGGRARRAVGRQLLLNLCAPRGRQQRARGRLGLALAIE